VQLALLGLIAIGLVLLPARAGAVQLNGVFELDGNAVVNHNSPGLPDDWSRVYDGTSSAFASTFIGASVEAQANDTSYYTGGGSKNDNDISQWSWANHASPDKNEINDAFAAAYVVPQGNPEAGHIVLYFGMDRYSTDGDSNLGFWFLQDPAVSLNSDGSFSGKHVNGDLFVGSDFTNGGSSSTIAVYRWDSNAQGGPLVPLTTGAPCTADFVACGAVNDSDVQVPWPYTPKSGTPGTVPANGLFEGGIDLNLLLGDSVLPCFSSFAGQTRSSQAVTSELKDVVLGKLHTCGSIELKKDWSSQTGTTTLTIGSTPGAGDIATKTVTADDTTGAQTVDAGTYYASETAITNFASQLACENDNGQSPATVAVGQGNSVQVAPGDAIVCTFTNSYVKASPGIGTTLSATEVRTGSSVHDSSALSGARAPAGGTVTYTVYTDNACTAGAVDAGTKTVTNGIVPDSNALQFNIAGDYYWQAVYSGDDNNNGASSPCTHESSEHLVVDRPAIELTKTPATQAVDSGGTANFTITVTNSGTVALTSVTVSDPLSTGCNKSIGPLAAGKSTSYTCSKSGVTTPFTNVATVAGHPPVGADVTASGSANVNVNAATATTTTTTSTTTITTTQQSQGTPSNVVTTTTTSTPPATTATTSTPPATTTTTTRAPFTPPRVVTHPAISISKAPASQSLASGGTATFRITVKNTGDVSLTGVSVNDPLSRNCHRSIGTLASGASHSYSCTRTHVKASFDNVATATGKPPTGAKVSATDKASVKAAAFTPPKPRVKPVRVVKIAKPKPKPKPKVKAHVKPKLVSHIAPKTTG